MPDKSRGRKRKGWPNDEEGKESGEGFHGQNIAKLAGNIHYHLQAATQQQGMRDSMHDAAAMLGRQAHDNTTNLRMMLGATVSIVNSFNGTKQQDSSHAQRDHLQAHAALLGPPAQWNTAATVEYLRTLGYVDYADYFQLKRYNGQVLLGLTIEELEEMSMEDKLVRKALLRTIKELLNNNPSV
jgi:hypothetical protein